MKALVLDGYTDEPACLGVPPYIAPYPRLAFGALKESGAEVSYATIDQWRAGHVDLTGYRLLAVIRHVAVPGKYLRGMPASDRELAAIASSFRGTSMVSLGLETGRVSPQLRETFDHVVGGDFDAALFDLISGGGTAERRRTAEEWDRWLVRGAECCKMHPDHGGPLIAEMQMYRGCVRYISGGCSFCVEPLQGEVAFRAPESLVREAEALSAAGVRNLRLGAQSCVYCYMSEDTGRSEVPRPNAAAVIGLLKGIRSAVQPEVFHLDNANPAVIAEYPAEARIITKAIAEQCTSGNVLAFGLESADPAVARANNLNATSEQTLVAVRIVNEIGGERGPTGLPRVLPGINFVCGLRGERKETYRLNLEFLRTVLREGLLLRRINIRQVMPTREDFPGVVSRRAFMEFRRRVREEIDSPMLEKLVPDRTILRGVYTELNEGGKTYGRQVGSYPLLVSLPYTTDIGRRMDVAVTGRGYRSVTGVEYPMDANRATLSMLSAVPGIGRKRAAAIIRARPFKYAERLWALIDEPKALESAQFHLTCSEVVVA